jgi:lon-related putative ATP-dependent protease
MNNSDTGQGARALTAEQVRRSCQPGDLGFASTAEVREMAGVVGQQRALGALEFGVRISGNGFNLYVLGNPGTQRHDVVRDFLRQEAAGRPAPEDWCYVNNFDDPQKPAGIRLPAGHGTRLRTDMSQLLEDLRASVPAAFESENYRNRRAEIEQEFHDRHRRGLEAIQNEAESERLGLIPTPHGFAIAPVRDGHVLEQEEFSALPQSERERTEAAINRLSESLQHHLEQLPVWHKDRRRLIKELDRQVTMLAVGSLIDQVRQQYAAFAPVVAYLDAVQRDVLDNAQQFLGDGDTEATSPMHATERPPMFRRYEVNIVVNHARTQGAPVVYESNPSLSNLVGRIEHTSQFGTLVTDFTMIRAGALHAASGGYLILDAEKVLLQPLAWESLKRALTTREIRIESLAQAFSLVSTQGLEPDAMPLDVKVVVIGNRLLYYLLCEFDQEFPQLFKVAADFEDHVERTPGNVKLYGRLLANMAQAKQLLPFDAAAIAGVIEESARATGDGERLTTHLRGLNDLLSEADFWGRRRGGTQVERTDVDRAVAERVHRLDRIRSEMRTAIRRNITRIRTDGTEIGQVNGLSVLQLGNFSFGQPSRISATVRLGEGRVLDIEREVELGGAIHSKGVMILASYLGARYMRAWPLSLAASLVFEQSYGGVEGDSASVAELLALLSAIARVPLRQDIAVTGAVDQLGNVQAIGGVNQKIEGFFDVCNARGLTGRQGVLIPADNVQHLMLRNDVFDAIAAKRFAVYEVRTVDDAAALLSGLPAASRGADGTFEPGSLNRLVEDALQELSRQRREFAGHASEMGRSEKP